MLSFIVYTVFILFSFYFVFLFSLFILGFKQQTSIFLLNKVFVQPLRMLVQSEPHSHAEYVHFEPSPVMVSLGRIKDFHVVRAKLYYDISSNQVKLQIKPVTVKY
jgi:hypothetical protein